MSLNVSFLTLLVTAVVTACDVCWEYMYLNKRLVDLPVKQVKLKDSASKYTYRGIFGKVKVYDFWGKADYWYLKR